MKIKFFSAIPRIEGARLCLKRLTDADAAPLARLAGSDAVYRFLPTFLYERKYPDIHRVISGLYGECLRESIILGVFLRDGDRFCGLAEMYGLRDEIHKVSIGYRLLEAYWGQGIATQTVGLLTDYLFAQTDI